ncbi:MAG: UvrB/UvrC motif-containing protein [Oscillospiraceae bacterium]|jgi:protein arginine kinase activator|nr:UvrB/UvrC motif-containing protein [Oscillospiraceae bacterium]
MICEMCKHNMANTVIRVQHNGTVQELFLCSACAQTYGVEEATFASQLGELFSAMLGASQAVPRQKHEASAETCAFCGMSLREIQKSGHMGCPICYETFRDAIAPTLRKLHGAAQHRGKTPAHAQAASHQNTIAAQIEDLRAKIAEAVAAENYEEAARLKAEILRLEQGGAQ